MSVDRPAHNPEAPAESLFASHVPHDLRAPQLEVKNVCAAFGTRTVLEDVSFRLSRGERVAVVGPNGAGKSTLFRAIAGLIDPSSGDIKVHGHGPRGHFCIAFVVQRSQVDWTFPVTVADVVMMGRVREIGLFRHATARDRDFVTQCLAVVGMSELAGRQIGELSGGQQQRMFIARALAQEATLMLMDEPFTGLDVNTQQGLVDIIGQLASRGVTVLVATHDLDLAAEHFDRVILLNRRVVGFGPPAEVFTAEKLLAAFGGLTRAVPGMPGSVVVHDACCGGGDDARP